MVYLPIHLAVFNGKHVANVGKYTIHGCYGSLITADNHLVQWINSVPNVEKTGPESRGF